MCADPECSIDAKHQRQRQPPSKGSHDADPDAGKTMTSHGHCIPVPYSCMHSERHVLAFYFSMVISLEEWVRQFEICNGDNGGIYSFIVGEVIKVYQ